MFHATNPARIFTMATSGEQKDLTCTVCLDHFKELGQGAAVLQHVLQELSETYPGEVKGQS